MTNSCNAITIDDWLKTNGKVTATKLKAKLHERYNNTPDVDISTTIKRLENQFISVILSFGL